MRKINTQYLLTRDTLLTVNEQHPDNMSIHDYGESCGGIMKHWGSKKQLIKELQEIINALEKFDGK